MGKLCPTKTEIILSFDISLFAQDRAVVIKGQFI